MMRFVIVFKTYMNEHYKLEMGLEPNPNRTNRTLVIIEPEQNRTHTTRVLSHLYYKSNQAYSLLKIVTIRSFKHNDDSLLKENNLRSNSHKL